MATTYRINLTNGLFLVGIPEETTNTTAASINLYGRGVTQYGEGLQQNMIQMLENFAHASPPANPLSGQLWFNIQDGIMNVFNGSAWVGVQTPGSGTITDEMIALAAGLSISKLQSAAAPGQIIVSDIGGTPSYRTITGDIAIDDIGEVTITKDSKIELSGDVVGSATMVGLNDVNINVELGLNSVETDNISPLSVISTNLAPDSVLTDKILDAAVTTPKLEDFAVTETKLGNASVTEDKLGTSVVTTSKINDAAVTEAKINPNAVTTSKIQPQAVTDSRIADNAVQARHVDIDAIETDSIVDQAITLQKIRDGAVIRDKIADGAIDNAKLDILSVRASNIQDFNVHRSHLEDEAINTDKLEDLAVTGDKIAASSITADKLDVNGTAIGSDIFLSFNGSSLEFVPFIGAIPDEFITSNLIADGAITPDKIFPPSLTEDYGSLTNQGSGFSNEVNTNDLALGPDISFDYGIVEPNPPVDPLYETPDYGYLIGLAINSLDMGALADIVIETADYGTLA